MYGGSQYIILFVLAGFADTIDFVIRQRVACTCTKNTRLLFVVFVVLFRHRRRKRNRKAYPTAAAAAAEELSRPRAAAFHGGGFSNFLSVLLPLRFFLFLAPAPTRNRDRSGDIMRYATRPAGGLYRPPPTPRLRAVSESKYNFEKKLRKIEIGRTLGVKGRVYIDCSAAQFF